MATGIDYRRSDLRTNVLANPFWISSSLVDMVAAQSKAAMLFSFPTASRITLVHEICVQVVVACAGGTQSGTLGSGSLATDAITTAGTVTDVDVDEYMVTADVTWGTIGYYFPTNGSDFLTAKAAGSLTDCAKITGAATTVPCICIYPASTTTTTEGHVIVHALISHLPGF
jgi:hypothetical protein